MLRYHGAFHCFCLSCTMNNEISVTSRQWRTVQWPIACFSAVVGHTSCLMLVTHSQETCTKKLVQVNLYKKLDRLTWFLVQYFSCTSFSHRIQHSSIPYKKLACTSLEWWALIGWLPIAATVFILLCWWKKKFWTTLCLSSTAHVAVRGMRHASFCSLSTAVSRRFAFASYFSVFHVLKLQ